MRSYNGNRHLNNTPLKPKNGDLHSVVLSPEPAVRVVFGSRNRDRLVFICGLISVVATISAEKIGRVVFLCLYARNLFVVAPPHNPQFVE